SGGSGGSSGVSLRRRTKAKWMDVYEMGETRKGTSTTGTSEMTQGHLEIIEGGKNNRTVPPKGITGAGASERRPAHTGWLGGAGG
ncbi:unnamed protein product, partial [Discosporangium mesarthrocarpum]